MVLSLCASFYLIEISVLLKVIPTIQQDTINRTAFLTHTNIITNLNPNNIQYKGPATSQTYL